MMFALRRRYGHAADAPRAIRYIAKCRKCKAVTSGLSSGQNMQRDKGDPQRTGDVYTYNPPPGKWLPGVAVGSHVLDCRVCGEPRHANPVRGTYSAEKKCNARCLSSTGTTCECSCAGKNHGASWGSS